MKKDTLRYFVISIENYDTNEQISFDLDTNTINRGSGVITEYGNGWYRCSATISTTTDTVGAIAFYGTDSATVIGGNLRDGTKSVLVWGLQCEELQYATSYIPTNGSVATRLKDQVYRSGISNLINSDEGVLYAEFSGLGNDSVNRLISLSDGTIDNRVVIQYNNANDLFLQVRSGGTSVASRTYTLSDITDNIKAAVKYKENDFSMWVNGVEIHTDTSGAAPIGLNRLGFDNSTDGVVPFHGKVKDLRVYTTALSDEDLQYLTS